MNFGSLSLALILVQISVTQAAKPILLARQDTTILPSSSISSTSATPSPTSRNHNVSVGQNGTTFTPTLLKNIPVGDSITFYFYPSNFSVVRSTFDSPCTAARNSDHAPIFSGFHAAVDRTTIAAQKFVVHVTSTTPMWFYAVDSDDYKIGHGKKLCQDGMVMVVNAIPETVTGGQTLSAYRKAASSATAREVCPPVAVGGDVLPVSDKQRVRWIGRHPIGGNVKDSSITGNTNGTANGTSSNGDDANSDPVVASYVNESSVVRTGGVMLLLGVVTVLVICS